LRQRKSLIYIDLRPAKIAKIARVVTIAQTTAKIAVNGVAKKPHSECGLVDSLAR